MMRADPVEAGGEARPFAWLFELPPHTERTMRMESLIARLRLVILVLNTVLLTFVLDTAGMRMQAVWILVGMGFLYGIPLAFLQPYRRWRVFQTSMLSSLADSLLIAIFIGASGGSQSPFFPLYFLSVVAVAMRFELRQAVVTCAIYAFMYAVAYFVTWDRTADEFGRLAMNCSYMMILAVAVGHLAREEGSRSRQVDEIERLNQQNARLLSKTEKAARFDRLTGLLNRGFLEKDAQRELRRARTSGGYLSVLFCDMDKLKRINDELGHDTGDRVLRQAGAALRQRLRSQDIIGRYGGDEFVVILPSLTRETAFDRADQLIEAVRGINDALPEDLHVGLSIGVATFPFDAPDYVTLVKVADQAMYLAKREGGNRVRTANDLRLFWEEMPA